MKHVLFNTGVLGAVLLGVGIAGAQTAPAPSPPPVDQKEYLLKAVYLYALGCNIQWPASAFSNPNAPFVIGILGPDPFGKTLQDIARKKPIQGRKIVVKRFETLQDYRGPCQMVFVSNGLSKEEQQAVLRKLSAKGVLLVGESPGFAEAGGSVNFFRDQDRLRFEINASAAKRAGLEMGAQLLRLAEPVKPRHASEKDSSALDRVRLSQALR
ncbi:MAG: YfiR family protein [Pirellulales bacterium]|nr:YfiR family protein [Pirellulales bacterium]